MGLRTWSTIQGSVVGQAIYESGFEWQVTNSDEDRIANNRSLVSVRMWLRSTSGVGYSFNTNYNTSWKEHDGGNRQNISTAYDLRNISGTGKYYVGDGTSVFPVGSYFSFYVTHNGDGTRKLPITTYLYGGTGGFNSATTSTTVTLPTIPRYATITTFTFARKSGGAGIDTAGVTWATNDACDTIQYSLNSGGWVTASGSGTSGNFNITSLSPATYYTLKIRVKRTSSQLWTESGTLNITTYDIARLTVVPEGPINMDNNLTIQYTNPSGAALRTGIETAGREATIVPFRTATGSSYQFIFTFSEKENFYNKIPNSQELSLYIYLETIIGESAYATAVNRVFKIFDANPTFTNFTINDIDPITTTLTNTTSKFVEGYSDVEMGITTGNKAVAIKGATMSHYLVTSENFSDSVPYDPSNKVSVTIPNIVSNSVTVTAVDSRGNTKEVTKTGTLLEYFNVTASGTCVREGTLTEEVELNISGTFWNSSFGSVTNTLNMTYEYKKSGGSWVAGTSTPTIVKTGNNFTILGNIKGDTLTGFDTGFSYEVKVYITDKLYTKILSFEILSGSPHFSIDDNGLGLMNVFDDNKTGKVQLGGPVGIRGNLVVDNDTLISRDLNVTRNVKVTNKLEVLGDVAVDGALQVNENVAIGQAYDETLGGALQVNGDTELSGSLNITHDFGVQLNNNDTAIRIGEINSANLVFDAGAIQSRYNGVGGTLYLNPYGGEVLIGSGTTGTSVKINGSQILKENDVVDNLTSTSTTDPLSANQGKVIGEAIATKAPASTVDSRFGDVNSAISQKVGYGNVGVINCNDRKTKTEILGVYSSSNAPFGGIGILEVLYYSHDWVIQRFTSIEVSPQCWVRSFHSGTTWGSWQKKW